MQTDNKLITAGDEEKAEQYANDPHTSPEKAALKIGLLSSIWDSAPHPL